MPTLGTGSRRKMENTDNDIFYRFLIAAGGAARKLFLCLLCPADRFVASLFPAILLSAIYFYTALIPAGIYTNEMPADLYIFLDGAYRVTKGDIPHIDFISALGALNFAVPAYLQSFGLTPQKAFVAFNMCLVSMSMLLSAYVAYTRLAVFSGICFMVYIAALVAAPTPLGLDPSHITFAMYYNRFGWGLVCILGLLAIGGKEQQGITKILDGLVAGIIVTTLFYMKINYFSASLMILAAGAVLGLVARRAVLIGGLLFLGTAVFVESDFPGITKAYFADLAQAASSAKSLDLKILAVLRQNLYALAGPVLVFVLAGALTGKSFINRTTLYIVFLSLVSFFVIVFNWELTGLPLTICGYVFAFQEVLKGDQATESPAKQNTVAILIIMALFVPWLYETSARQDAFKRYVIDSLVYKYNAFEPSQKLDGVLIEGGGLLNLDRIDKDGFVKLSLIDLREMNMIDKPRKEIFPIQYAYTISDGAGILDSFFETNERAPLMVMDFSTPFSMMFDLPTPRGSYLWYHDGKNFSPENPVEPQKVFANVTYLMNPKFPMYSLARNKIWEAYGKYIEMNFELVRQEPLWEIWKKKTDSHLTGNLYN